MNRIHASIFQALGCLLAAGPVAATTVITTSSDFESPTFSPGIVAVNGVTGTGQGGWGGYNSVLVNNQLVMASIVNDQAHSGTQSMRTTFDTRPMNKALDPYNHDLNADPSAHEYPFPDFFTINNAVDWWVQAWVRIPSGSAGVTMTLLSGLGGCPLLQIQASGVPYVNSCLGQDTTQATLGTGAFDQWIALEMVHTTSMLQAMEFRITGPGISRTITLGSYSGPGSGPEAYVGLSGDAWWDDVRAGTGTAPTLVPLPGAAWLFGSAFSLLGLRRRPA